jgi:hypothetical protein
MQHREEEGRRSRRMSPSEVLPVPNGGTRLIALALEAQHLRHSTWKPQMVMLKENTHFGMAPALKREVPTLGSPTDF